MAFGDGLHGLSERLLAERKAEAAIGEARRLLRWLESNGHAIRLGEADDVVIVSPRPPADVAEALPRVKSALISLLKKQQEPS